MIYFIRPRTDEPFRVNPHAEPACRPIKIGMSVCPLERLEQISYSHKRFDLEVIGVMPGGILTERRMHRKFGHLRIRFANGDGVFYTPEWFQAGDDLLQFGRENMRPLETHDGLTAEFTLSMQDRLFMMMEQAAYREKISPDEFIKKVIIDYIKRDPHKAFPFRYF